MKKLSISAAVALAMFGSQAQAITLGGGDGTVPVMSSVTPSMETGYGSGSTAFAPFVEESMRTVCAGTIYKYVVSGVSTYVCERNTLAFTGANKQHLVFQKAEGGSIQGVQAASGINPTYLDIATLNATSCASVSNSVATCSGVTASTDPNPIASKMNIADVEPALFKSPLNGGFAGNVNGLQSSAVVSQTFGVVVNTRLRNALQQAQFPATSVCNPTNAAYGTIVSGTVTNGESEACMPSLTSQQIASIFSRNNDQTKDWRNLRFGTTSTAQNLFSNVAVADQPSNRDVHICTRAAGSGTWALFNAKFHNAPCNGGVDEAIQTPTTETLGAVEGATGADKIIHAMGGSGNLENCLEGLNDNVAKGTFNRNGAAVTNGFRWAIGIMGTERNDGIGAKKYRFVKIDGVSPSSKNIVEGKYKYWGEAVQVGAIPANTTLAGKLLEIMQDPIKIASLDKIGTWGSETGYLGVANNVVAANGPTFNSLVDGQLNASWDSGRPVNPYSHEKAAGGSLNHCRVPTLPSGNRAMPISN